IDLEPTAISYHQVLTRIAVMRGDAKAALAAAEQEPEGPFRDVAIALARQLGGDQAAARTALRILTGENAAYFAAEVYSIRGDRDKTFEWLDRAQATQDSGISIMLYD